MKAKTRFMKMFNSLPEKARRELIYDYPNNPMTLSVVAVEIQNDTRLGKVILKDLGFKDD